MVTRDYRQMACGDGMCWQGPLCEVIDEAKAENERLREALEGIRWFYGKPIAPDIKLNRIYDIAADALAVGSRTNQAPSDSVDPRANATPGEGVA